MGSPHEKVYAAQAMARRANEEVLRLSEENKRMRVALRKIAAHEYGDARSPESDIAQAALNALDFDETAPPR